MVATVIPLKIVICSMRHFALRAAGHPESDTEHCPLGSNGGDVHATHGFSRTIECLTMASKLSGTLWIRVCVTCSSVCDTL